MSTEALVLIYGLGALCIGLAAAIPWLMGSAYDLGWRRGYEQRGIRHWRTFDRMTREGSS